jgi:NAD(P)-dependent dehydrogenase (short-subunit alcohol dehydrogenase family)
MNDVTGQTMVITGASDGIGAAAGRNLRDMGANVVLVGRSAEKTAAVAKELRTDYYLCDFAELKQVRELAEKLLGRCPTIDVLANNAGLISGGRQKTKDGHEITFQVNYLAPFLLTHLLKDRLVASHAKILNTSSIAHRSGRVNLDDLENARNYSDFGAYANSKLANILFTRALQQKWGASGISAASFHPGYVATQFARENSGLLHRVYHSWLKHLFLTSPEKGADTLVWLASTKPGTDWQPGGYYVKRHAQKPSAGATDKALAEQLWQATGQLLGLPAEA